MSDPVRSEKAKQGRWGSPVLLVLVAGLILAGIVWFGVEIFGEATDTDPAVQSEADPQD